MNEYYRFKNTKTDKSKPKTRLDHIVGDADPASASGLLKGTGETDENEFF
jgi:hypothetical protein